MKYLIGLSLFLLLSCCSQGDKIAVPTSDIHQSNLTGITSTDTFYLEDVFIDSTTIGIKNLNKVEVSNYIIKGSNYVDVKLFEKQAAKWKLNQTIHFLRDDEIGCNPLLSDFNNDGLNDITIVSAVAARAANEIRRLFIFDQIQNQLREIKNSENYPNMLYNKELNCIDAFLFYGGCSTVFLRIDGDSLKEFASVELMDGLTVKEFDQYGNSKIIFEDTTNRAEYIRYRSYNPLKEYEDD
jgi:hypothetical protein